MNQLKKLNKILSPQSGIICKLSNGGYSLSHFVLLQNFKLAEYRRFRKLSVPITSNLPFYGSKYVLQITYVLQMHESDALFSLVISLDLPNAQLVLEV